MATTVTPAKVRPASAKRLGGNAAGAIGGQLSQALGSFAVAAIAARELGAAGLGVFALMYGSILLGTAVSSGLIGDSLTVLSRDETMVRTALQNWCLIVSALAGVIATAVGLLSHSISFAAAVAFGVVTFVFIVEDALRRALMAVFRFWRLPVVDFASLIGSLAYLGVVLVVLDARPTVGQFLVALLIGQAVAALVAVPLLPAHERPIWRVRTSRMGQVFGFGAWRAAQQSVRPALLTGARIMVTLIAGVAAYGQLEAARVYMAPALLVVSGLGSMMLPMWVRDRRMGLRRLTHRADLAAVGLFGITLVVGVIGTAVVPIFGSVLTGGKFDIQAAAVLGWVAYAAATAAVTPFGTLAALQGRQGRVMAMRLIEPVVGLSLVVVALGVFDRPAEWAPYALAVGAIVCGLSIRLLILPAMAHEQDAGPKHSRSTRRVALAATAPAGSRLRG